MLHISTDGDYDSDLGSIIAETEELDRFKITSFLGSLFTIVSSNKFKPKFKFNSLSKLEKDDFMKHILGILVHELTHLIDYFRYTREELLKDFRKFYLLQDGEKKAFVEEFLFHFVSEDGVQIVKRTNDKNIFIGYVKRKMKCWQLLDRMNIEPNKEFINSYLGTIYDYFKLGKNEFGKLKTERVYEIPPFVCVTRLSDIADFELDDLSKATISILNN